MAARGGSAATYRFVNLGCPKNLVDAERVAALLERDGWRAGPEGADADLVVVTTCAFISSAREESVDEIVGVAAAKRPGQRIAVLGCLVTREGEETLRKLIPEVDVFCSVDDMRKLPAKLRKSANAAPGAARRRPAAAGGHDVDATGRRLFTPPHVAYLKIADGCSNRCAYCAIPAIRGDLRSRPRREILAEARGLAAAGVRELVVVAQDTTAWGRDRRGRETVYDLLAELADAARFDWIRLMYTHPAHLDAKRVGELMRAGAIVPYLDVPIQHASDRILKLMGRRYTRTRLERLFDDLRAACDGVVLRTTVLVGFPGEKETDFRELADFLEDVSFDHVGAFEYSRERDTKAASLAGRVPARVAAARRNEIVEMQMAISEERLAARLGSELEIIVDEALPAEERPDAKSLFAGRFYGQAHEIDGLTYVRGRARPGSLVRARIVEAAPYDLFAEPVGGDFR